MYLKPDDETKTPGCKKKPYNDVNDDVGAVEKQVPAGAGDHIDSDVRRVY